MSSSSIENHTFLARTERLKIFLTDVGQKPSFDVCPTLI